MAQKSVRLFQRLREITAPVPIPPRIPSRISHLGITTALLRFFLLVLIGLLAGALSCVEGSTHQSIVQNESLVLKGRVPKPRESLPIDLRPSVYIVLRAPGLQAPARVSSAPQLFRITGKLEDSTLCHGFPGVAEAEAYFPRGQSAPTFPAPMEVEAEAVAEMEEEFQQVLFVFESFAFGRSRFATSGSGLCDYEALRRHFASYP